MNCDNRYLILLNYLSFRWKNQDMIRLYFMIVFAGMLLLSGQLNAQITVQQLHDQLVKKLKKKDWEVVLNENNIQLVMRDSVWTQGNISAIYYTDEEWMNMVKNHPAFKHIHLATVYKLDITFEEKWTTEKTNATNQFNADIQTQIDSLPVKYEIVYLKGPKGMYSGDTRAENKRIMKYIAALEILHDSKKPLPKYHTSTHSIFVDDHHVFDGYRQHPEWTSYSLIPSTAQAKRTEAWELVKQLINGR